MAISVGSLALLLALVLLPVVIGMAWVTWVSMGRMANLASRGLGMAEEMQRHAWSASLSKNPEQANLAGQLEVVGRRDYGEILQNQTNLQRAPTDPYPDDTALGR